MAPENGWLEYYIVSFWDGLFSGAMLVSGRVSKKTDPVFQRTTEGIGKQEKTANNI